MCTRPGAHLLLEGEDLELELALNLGVLGLDALEALDALANRGRERACVGTLLVLSE
jgi:hypothetical protein